MNGVFVAVAWFVVVLIAVAAGVNVWVFLKIKRNIRRLEGLIRPKNDRRNGVLAGLEMTAEECRALSDASAEASRCYTLYVNLTAIFPLLGILGTVASLMGLGSVEDLSGSFASALWTTFLGLIAAITFKVMDSGVSSQLDRLLDEADYLIRGHDIEKRSADAEKK